jgi:hypothetical protein
MLLEFICICCLFFFDIFWYFFMVDAADVTNESDVVDPWAESDAKLDYNPWEPHFPSTAWGRLSEAGWHGAKSPSRLERRRIAVLIVVRNHFRCPFGRGCGGVGGRI